MIFTPLDSLIYVHSNDVTNSIFLFLDIQLNSLEHITYFKGIPQQIVK